MPKKKRCAIINQLDPLEFVHSPTFDDINCVSPDLAVENPLTAKVVPIEEFNTWVCYLKSS